MIGIFTRKNLPLVALLILAAITRFAFLSYPAEVVFDEVHFGKFVSAYFTSNYYFDIHPPLGKMMISGFAALMGMDFTGDPEKIFEHIGGAYDRNKLLVLRFLPALSGVFFVFLVYRFLKLIGLSPRAVFLGTWMVIFENSILGQSKLILIDIFFLTFGLAALYFFFASKKEYLSSRKKNVALAAAAFFAALAFSIKWTGLAFLGVIMLAIFWDFWRERKIGELIKRIIFFVIIPFTVYFSIFVIHFALVYRSGPGDAYMSQAFQKTLIESKVVTDESPLNSWGKFKELNLAMYRYNKGITTGHPDGSSWYEWSLDRKPVWYWVKGTPQNEANIYFFGNPFIYFLALVSVIFSVFTLVYSNQAGKFLYPLAALFVIAYFANLLPFILVSRVSFLYHYLPALIFGIFLAVMSYDSLSKKLNQKNSEKIYYGIIGAVFLIFIFVSPLTYGFPLAKPIVEIYKSLLSFFQ